MPMESMLHCVASILAGFDFTFVDYAIDGGEGVVKKAMDYYMSHGGGSLHEESILAIRRYIKCRYDQMKVDAIKWHPVLPVLFTGDQISFCFQGTSVSGTVYVSPKIIGLTMREPFDGLHDEVRIKASVPIIFTQDLAEGSPANSEGIACAQNMLERLYFSHAGI